MLDVKKWMTKVTNYLNQLIVVEVKGITFSNGTATLAAKSGYYLSAIYPCNRSDSSYGITNWTEQTDGSYVLKNAYTTLNASLNARVIWVKSS